MIPRKSDSILRLEAERHRQRLADLNRKFDATIQHIEAVSQANEAHYRSRMNYLASTPNVQETLRPPPSTDSTKALRPTSARANMGKLTLPLARRKKPR